MLHQDYLNKWNKILLLIVNSEEDTDWNAYHIMYNTILYKYLFKMKHSTHHVTHHTMSDQHCRLYKIKLKHELLVCMYVHLKSIHLYRIISIFIFGELSTLLLWSISDTYTSFFYRLQVSNREKVLWNSSQISGHVFDTWYIFE